MSILKLLQPVLSVEYLLVRLDAFTSTKILVFSSRPPGGIISVEE